MTLRWVTACIVALAVAVLTLLLALDVGRWQTTISHDDVRFKATPTRANLWRPDELLPFHAARSLLRLDDDIEYRETLRNFWLARPHGSSLTQLNLDALRSEAIVTLANFAREQREPLRRGQTANLLGVMGLGLATTDDPGQRLRFLLYASRAFRGALTADPNNEDAKFNLELTLRLLQRQPTRTGGGTAHGPGRASGAALAQPGSGY
ncbi:MAG: hypothetical protein H0W90_06145 [Actinobacteria bacterium]|nr:hypothetical protein [Actinomycetota bacterium]